MATEPSQFKNPLSHDATVHDIDVHASVAAKRLHALPQVPQLPTVVVGVSHPLLARPSQFAKPPPQVTPHAPAAHVAVPFAPLHTAHVAPHRAGSVFTSVASQPSAALPLQSAVPVGQPTMRTPHTPAVHDAVVPVGAGHTRPHDPQFAGSLCRLKQLAPHAV